MDCYDSHSRYSKGEIGHRFQAAGNAAAANGLAALQLNTTPDAAAGLLKAIGWWGPHEQLALLRLHVSPNFEARLQVQPPFCTLQVRVAAASLSG